MTVTRLPNAPLVSDLGATLVEHARQVAASFGESLSGFLVIGVDDAGRTAVGARLPVTMSTVLFHAVITEATRRDLVTETEIHRQLARVGVE